MTFVSRTMNAINPKFVAVSTCSESTECNPSSKRALPSSVSLHQRDVLEQINCRTFLLNSKGQVRETKSTEPESVPVLENL